MSRLLFALAVVVALVSISTAEEKPAAAPAPTTAPVVVPAPLTSSYVPTTTSTRRGLFGRLRGRSASNVMSAMPVSTGTVITTPAPTTTVPAPMPAVTPKPTSGAAVTGNPVVVAGGTTTPSKVVPAGMMTPGTPVVAATDMTVAQATATTAKRMGLIARLRARR